MVDQMVWSAPDGSTINLSNWSAGYFQLADNTTGLRSPTYDLSTVSYAGIDGTTVTAVRAQASEPTVALLIEAATKQAFRAKARALVRSMRPKAGLGTLTVTSEWGESRSLSCYCVGGLEGDQANNVGGSGLWWRMVLKFYAPSPWWRGDVRSIMFGLSAPTSFFPITPVVLSSSNIQGALTVDLSDADAPSFPVWTVTGPGSALTLTNTTTGRTIQVTTPIGDGQSLIIDTRPGMQSVRDGNGVNLMGSLSSDPALFPLVEGVNQISALLAGAGPASSISGTYAPSYAGI